MIGWDHPSARGVYDFGIPAISIYGSQTITQVTSLIGQHLTNTPGREIFDVIESLQGSNTIVYKVNDE